jgi:regulatory protein
MTSESRPDRDAGGTRAGHRGVGWHGDVAAGVAAWTGGAPAERPDVPPDSVGDDPDADAESVARTILLDALTGQARSRHELRAKLAKRRVPPELAESLLDRFTEVGLVDDGAFARSWVESRQRSRGLARRALAQELRRKGVADDVARSALDELDPEDEESAARALVRKRLRGLRDVDHATATRRLAGMLARKGYPPGLSFAIVREELGSPDEGSDMMDT